MPWPHACPVPRAALHLLFVEFLFELEDAVNKVTLQLLVTEIDTELLEGVHIRGCVGFSLLVDEGCHWRFRPFGWHELETENVEHSHPVCITELAAPDMQAGAVAAAGMQGWAVGMQGQWACFGGSATHHQLLIGDGGASLELHVSTT